MNHILDALVCVFRVQIAPYDQLQTIERLVDVPQPMSVFE